MASFYKSAAAACLVALCGLQSEATPVKTYKFSAVDVGEEAYLSVNLLRNGKLLIRISEVARDEDLVTTLKNQVVEGGALTDGTCDDMKIKSDLKEMFYRAFEYNTDTPDYRQLLQEALNAGFDAFTNKEYPKDETAWGQVWGTEAGSNLAYLLGSTSTTIGCVIGRCTEVEAAGEPVEFQAGRSKDPNAPTVTQTDKAMLFCQLNPPAEKGKAPFGEEYFNGLIARQTLLKDMTAEDLNVSVEAGFAAATAVPTVLTSGLLAMLTAISA